MKKRLWNYAKTKVHDTSGIEEPHMWTWRQCNGGIYFPDYHIHIAKSEDLWNMELRYTDGGATELVEIEGTIKLVTDGSREPNDIDWQEVPDCMSDCWEDIEEILEEWAYSNWDKSL